MQISYHYLLLTVHTRNFIDVTVYLISVPTTMVFYVSVLESYYMSLK